MAHLLRIIELGTGPAAALSAAGSMPSEEEGRVKIK
jgi:hypothetical protein